jgi:electron transfer flavoprotein beta subunit
MFVVVVLNGAERTADQAAVEHAVRLSGSHTGRCLAVGVGSGSVQDALRAALAAGVDEALRIEESWHGEDDGRLTATAIANAVVGPHGRPDVVVCGHVATSAVAAFLAAEFGAAQALGLLELTTAGSGLRGVRRLDGGRRESLSIPLPAVCSVEAGSVPARRAALPSVLAAQRATIPLVTADVPVPTCRIQAGAPRPYRPRPRELPPPTGRRPHDRLLALIGTTTGGRAARLIAPAGPAEAAEELLAYLRERGYLDEESV